MRFQFYKYFLIYLFIFLNLDEELAKMAEKLGYDTDTLVAWFNDRQQKLTNKNTTKKFKQNNNISNILLNESVSNENSNNSMCSPNASICSPLLQQQHHHSHTQAAANTLKINHFRTFTSLNTPNKQLSVPTPPTLPSQQLSSASNLKSTPSVVSSLSLSSPSAAAVFNLNSGNNSSSFQMSINEITPQKSNSNSKINIEQKLEMISATSESMSFLDEALLSAFINDYSYEIVQK
jgi:hypothetical protein